MGMLDFLKKKREADRVYAVGDTYFFGKYYFENEKDMRPMAWTVLQCDETHLLLISKYCIDVVKYCEPSAELPGIKSCVWERSYLRNWLNTTFYNQAFQKHEQQKILETQIVTDDSLDAALHQNKVFLLSPKQAMELMPDKENRIGFPTPYALEKGASVGYSDEKATWWWTLPHIEDGIHQSERVDYPSAMCQDGEVRYHGRLMYYSHYTVRPAIKIKR